MVSIIYILWWIFWRHRFPGSVLYNCEYLLLLVTVPQSSTKLYILLRQTPLNNCFRNFDFDFGEKKTYSSPLKRLPGGKLSRLKSFFLSLYRDHLVERKKMTVAMQFRQLMHQKITFCKLFLSHLQLTISVPFATDYSCTICNWLFLMSLFSE